MAVLFGWNNDEIVGFAAKLDKIHRAALPNAVRSTLNDAAFGMKKTSILEGAKKTMTVRKPSAFRAYSAFDKATGWNINSMASSAGMIDKSNSNFGQDIAKQEFGGSVDHKAYIAHSKARTGKGLVSKNGRDVLSNSKKPIVHRGESSKKKNIITDAHDAYTQNRALLWVKGETGILYQIKSFNKSRNAKLKFKAKKIATYKKGRVVPIKTKRPFIMDAANIEEQKLNSNFRKHADKQIAKFIK